MGRKWSVIGLHSRRMRHVLRVTVPTDAGCMAAHRPHSRNCAVVACSVPQPDAPEFRSAHVTPLITGSNRRYYPVVGIEGWVGDRDRRGLKRCLGHHWELESDITPMMLWGRRRGCGGGGGAAIRGEFADGVLKAIRARSSCVRRQSLTDRGAGQRAHGEHGIRR